MKESSLSSNFSGSSGAFINFLILFAASLASWRVSKQLFSERSELKNLVEIRLHLESTSNGSSQKSSRTYHLPLKNERSFSLVVIVVMFEIVLFTFIGVSFLALLVSFRELFF